MVTYNNDVDEMLVFRALADPNRRRLLDALFESDGLPLIKLEAHLAMTRFGCMKHLRVLEQAGLVITKRKGREKLHYLNPVPIQSVYDRWVEKYARPVSRALTSLKQQLEDPMTQQLETKTHVFEIYIRTSLEKLWDALTNGQHTPHFYFGTTVKSELKVGSPFQYFMPDGTLVLDGEILEIHPKTRLVTSWQAQWDEEAKTAPITRVIYELEPQGDVVRLRLTHEGLPAGLGLTENTFAGWSRIVSSLKSYLETGSSL